MSSFVTLKRTEGIKSPAASSQLITATIQEGQPTALRTKSPGHSRKSGSNASKRHSQAAPGIIETQSSVNEGYGMNRWSHSTTSSMSGGNGHARGSSYSRRFSFASPTSLTNGTNQRSPSPMKSIAKAMPALNGSQSRSGRSDSLSQDRIQPLNGLSHPKTPNTAFKKSDTAFSRDYREHKPFNSASLLNNSDLQQIPTFGSRSSNDEVRTSARPSAASNTQQRSQASSRAVSPEKSSRFRSDSEHSGKTGLKSTRSKREKEKKSMLSKALQLANNAVLLDNGQDYEAALAAYEEACTLLGLAMERSSTESDQKKLRAIRGTYATRIQELRVLDLHYSSSDEKPPRPASEDTIYRASRHSENDATNEDREPPIEDTPLYQSESSRTQHAPVDSLERRPTTADVSTLADPAVSSPQAPSDLNVYTKPSILPISAGRNYLPEPLLTRQLSSNNPGSPSDSSAIPKLTTGPGHQAFKDEDVLPPDDQGKSWINPSNGRVGSSRSSSVHSVSSRNGLHRKHLRTQSGETEAEFDAALDAAVEAAYGGYDPPYDIQIDRTSGDSLHHAQTLISDPAGLGVDRESLIVAAKSRADHLQGRLTVPMDDDEGVSEGSADEEERLLDEMTKEYLYDGIQTEEPATIPRQSNSSSFTGRSYGSSVASSATTAGTSLSTVGEDTVVAAPFPTSSLVTSTSLPPTTSAPSLPPPLSKLPSPPIMAPPSLASPGVGLPSPSVRTRRLADKGATRLQIETAGPRSVAPRIQPEDQSTSPTKSHSTSSSVSQMRAPFIPSIPLTSPIALKMPGTPSAETHRQFSTLSSGPSSADNLPKTLLEQSTSGPYVSRESNVKDPQSASPPQNFSRTREGAFSTSSSTLSLRNASMVAPGSGTAGGSHTPMDFGFSPLPTPTRTLLVPPALGSTPHTSPVHSSFGRPLPQPSESVHQTTPVTASFARVATPNTTHIFDSDFHSAKTPGSPNPLSSNAPNPLEPCPTAFLLRPFWLMRCLYQTLENPRGGYISNRLFVPRGVWMVKNVKLKAVEEKISNCDLLTAALLKLRNVDTLDADAVLDEMQALENVLDRAQNSLTKKLGAEVGVQGLASVFKDAPATSPDGSQTGDASAQASKSGGRSFSSWRKLRSKGSAAGLANSYTGPKGQPEKNTLVMSTLPMTSLPRARFAKSDVNAVECIGPNADYMSALAKLFDASQVLDQIARQVEDPGLKHSSPTHVGLELSARHASEFFAFYICRFVLTDISMLLEKFIKRASEWVLV